MRGVIVSISISFQRDTSIYSLDISYILKYRGIQYIISDENNYSIEIDFVVIFKFTLLKKKHLYIGHVFVEQINTIAIKLSINLL